jgi:type IV secretory pathway TraG/TraD family ATPase VirD4
MLQLALISQLYAVGVVGWLTWPYSGALLVLVLWALASKKPPPNMTAFGTARWAAEEDLSRKKMLDAESGIILGRIQLQGGTRGFWQAARELFRGKGSAEDECWRFIQAARPRGWRRPREAVVSLPQTTHNAVIFGPVGSGKSTGLFLPWLLSEGNDESTIVIDFKGELSTNSALARQKMGHEILILDPYKVVTQ